MKGSKKQRERVPHLGENGRIAMRDAANRKQRIGHGRRERVRLVLARLVVGKRHELFIRLHDLDVVREEKGRLGPDRVAQVGRDGRRRQQAQRLEIHGRLLNHREQPVDILGALHCLSLCLSPGECVSSALLLRFAKWREERAEVKAVTRFNV